jgi:hypothetical protein
MKKIGKILMAIALFTFMITMANGPSTTNPARDAQLAGSLLLISTGLFIVGLLFLLFYGIYWISKKIFPPLILNFQE